MKMKAYAKINLTLEITGKILPGGFHELKTIMHKAPIYDELEIKLNDTGRVNFECDKQLCDTKDNLAYRAAELFLGAAEGKGTIDGNVGADIVLKKNIPHGAGLGGGSADAAAVLDGLRKLTGALEKDELYVLANLLGSDVAFCLYDGKCAYCTGRGEIITPAPELPMGVEIRITKPQESLSTKGIYAEYDEKYAKANKERREFKSDKMLSALKNADIDEICKNLCNDFEPLCISRLPQIAEHKKKHLENGAKASCMSGSGSAVFALF